MPTPQKVRARRDAGFSLVQLMAALVIVGILAAIALARYQDHVEKAAVAAMVHDLDKYRGGATVYFTETGDYPLPNVMKQSGKMVFSPEVEVDSAAVRSTGFYVRLRHPRSSYTCEIDYSHDTSRGTPNRVVCPGVRNLEKNAPPSAGFAYTAEGDGTGQRNLTLLAGSGSGGSTPSESLQGSFCEGACVCTWDLGEGETSDTCYNTATFGPGSCTYVDSKGRCYRTVSVTITDSTGTRTFEDDIVINEPPEDDGPIYISGPRTVGSTLTFDASSSQDPEGDPLLYSWSLGDGAMVHDLAVPATTYMYPEPGDYRVDLTVKDPWGATARASQTITIADPGYAPVARFTVNPEEPRIGDMVTLDASGTTDSDTPVDSLTFQWKLGDGSSATGPVVEHAYEYATTAEIRLTVRDPEGNRGEAVYALGIPSENQPPTPKFSVPGDTIARNETITLDAGGSRDPDGDAMTYRWDFGDGTQAEGKRVTHAWRFGGQKRVQLEARDARGASAVVSHHVYVQNRKPVAAFTLSDTVVGVGQPITADATGSSDPDGDGLIFDWYWGDSDRDEGAGMTPTHTYNRGGTFTVQLVVRDGLGGQGGASRTVRVANQSPVIETFEASTLSADVDEQIWFTTSASDPEGSSLTWLFEWGDGTSTPRPGNEQMLPYAWISPGTYTVKGTASDGQGGWATDSVVVTIGAVEPAYVSAMRAALENGFDAAQQARFGVFGAYASPDQLESFGWTLPPEMSMVHRSWAVQQYGTELKHTGGDMTCAIGGAVDSEPPLIGGLAMMYGVSRPGEIRCFAPGYVATPAKISLLSATPSPQPGIPVRLWIAFDDVKGPVELPAYSLTIERDGVVDPSVPFVVNLSARVPLEFTPPMPGIYTLHLTLTLPLGRVATDSIAIVVP